MTKKIKNCLIILAITYFCICIIGKLSKNKLEVVAKYNNQGELVEIEVSQ